MLDQLYTVIFSLIISGLTIIEKKRISKIITPFTLAAWPFVIIAVANNFILIHFKFQSITTHALLFILVNLIILWIIGFISSFFLFNKNKIPGEAHYQYIFHDISPFQNFVIIISWIIFSLTIYKIYTLITRYGGFLYLGTFEYEDEMITGPIAHLGLIAQVCFLLLIFMKSNVKHKYIFYITLVALFITIASKMVKYHLIWVIMITFLFYIINKPLKKQVRSIVTFSLILFGIFNMFWIFLTLTWGTFSLVDENIYIFFFKQFSAYFFSGPINLEHWMNYNSVKPDWTLFVVFLNLKNILMGDPSIIYAVPLLNTGFIEVAPDVFSNVGTSYGVYYLIGGYTFTFFMVILVSFITYILFFKSFEKKSKIIVFLNLLFLTLSCLNFFGLYFVFLSLYEIVIIFTIFIILFKIFNTIIFILNKK